MKKQLEPIIVDQDQLKIDEMNEGIETTIPVLQQAWDEFKQTPYFDQSTPLATLIQNHESIKQAYKLKLVQELHPVPEGSVLELDATEEAKKWKIPTPQLDIAIAQVNEVFIGNSVNISFFELRKGKVIARKEAVQKYADHFSIIVVSDQGRRYLELSKKVIEILQEMDGLARPAGMILLNRLHPLPVNRLWKFDGENYSDNTQLIRRMEKIWLRIQEEKSES